MTERNLEPHAGAWLVFGASGAVGRFLLPELAACGVQTLAVSRDPHPVAGAPAPTLRWVQADLERAASLGAPTVVASLGPVDHFAAWLARSWPDSARRIVALSSTSAATKARSPDPSERALAGRLREAESVIARECERRGADWTILRPTLVYGGGGDRNLSRLVALARRFGVLPLPGWATGLRQPVHAQDLAHAVLASAQSPAAACRGYDLPGGETLSYRAMVERVLACLPRPPRLTVIPDPLSRPLFALATLGTGLRATLARTRENLVFDAGDAQRDFGYRARGFEPHASMFE